MSTPSLIHNYFVTAVRNLITHKLDSVINIIGLAVGLASAIFIVLFLRDELSYDRWIPNSSNLYRLEVTFHLVGRSPQPFATAPFPALTTMLDHIPEVRAVTHLLPEPMTVTVGDKQFLETIAFVDPAFFQVIRLPLTAGNPATVLSQPESIVLSQRVASKYFGTSSPLGRIVSVTGSASLCGQADTACIAGGHPLVVTGVLTDLPSNTQLIADLVVPNTSQADDNPKAYREHQWSSTDGVYAYLNLAPNTAPETVLAKLRVLLERTVGPDQLGGVRITELEEFRLTRFWDAHLTSDNYGGMRPPGSRATVHGFAAIALLIMIVACFNFMNLATARSTLRAKEIALRKAVGATRWNLIIQFLGESVLMAFVSLTVSLTLIEILLPRYDAFLGRPITLNYLVDWPILTAITATAVVAGLLSGLWPALVLSSFRPADAMKTGPSTQSGSGVTRMALVAGQFSVSIGLGIAALVVFSQTAFARHIELGFDRDGIVVLRGIKTLTAPASESLSRALRSNPQIVNAALSNAVPFDLFSVDNLPVQVQGKSQPITAHIINISPEFPSVYGMRLAAGRLLSHDHGEDVFKGYPFFHNPAAPDADDGRNVLINAETARHFGFTAEEAVGKALSGGNGHVIIAGVLADSKIDGLRQSESPAVFVDYPSRNTLLSIRIRGERIPETLAYIDKTWHSFTPGSVVQRYFLNDAFDSLFQSDEKQGVMFAIFVGIAISIACLGLFGVAAFTAARRTKEIGLRKVMGARTIDIVGLLLWQFTIPVLIANAIAWPIAYFYLHRWLENYAYRISLNPRYFLTAGLVALAIAWITIVAHALRAAGGSPIVALRYE